MPHAPSEEAPGEKEEHKDTEEYPARSLDQHLQAVNLCHQEISQQAEGGVPQGSGHQLISQEAPVLHPGHPGAQRHKRTELPDQVRHENRLSAMFCDQPMRQPQPSGQPYAATQPARAPPTGNTGQDEPPEEVVDVIAQERSLRGQQDHPAQVESTQTGIHGSQ